MPRQYTSYIHVHYQEPDDEYDDELTISCCIDERYDLLAHEIANAGDDVFGDYLEDIKKLSNGYYEVVYNSCMDSESDGYGYEMYSYEVVDGFVSFKKTFKAYLIGTYWHHIMPKVHAFQDLFTKSWGVDFDYGGAGLAVSGLFLPKALFIRYIRCKVPNYDPGWGKEFKAKINSPLWWRR